MHVESRQGQISESEIISRPTNQKRNLNPATSQGLTGVTFTQNLSPPVDDICNERIYRR